MAYSFFARPPPCISKTLCTIGGVAAELGAAGRYVLANRVQEVVIEGPAFLPLILVEDQESDSRSHPCGQGAARD